MSNLNNLYDFIAGEGIYENKGTGIHTFPKSGTKLHGMCEELENEGKIKRVFDNGEMVSWESTRKSA